MLDAEGHEIKRVRYRFDGVAFDEKQPNQSPEMALDAHDAIVFDDDSYIVTAHRVEDVDDIPEEFNLFHHTRAEVVYIQEVENGSVKWQFSSRDYPQFYASKADHSSESDNFSEDFSDYMHFNSMAIDPTDGNLLVSFRNQCSIVKLSRETGEPLWVMGGKGDQFNLSEEARFACQHAISFTASGNLLLYDNRIEGENSRILELAVDEAAKTAVPVRSVPLDVDTVNWGSVEELAEGIYLVNTGQTPNLDNPSGFFELNAHTGERSFSVTYPDSIDSYWVHKG